MFPAGPCTERLDSGYYQGHGQIPCAVYELQVSDEAYENAKLEVARIIEKAGEYHFNIVGLLCQFRGRLSEFLQTRQFRQFPQAA